MIVLGRKYGLAVLVAALVSLGAAVPMAQAKTPACSSGTLVQTHSGPVCGVIAKGQTNYLDIRYAAPPVGALRWMPPQPVKPWTSPYRATRRGRECAQPSFPAGALTKGTGEDCLFLEVQEPAHVKPGQKLPVMVELHGGGFLGEFRDDEGTNFVHSGPAIYVYVGYRLGILGFLADSALGAHSGDYGLMDQQAALRWVKDNIAGFGGNSHNVTIFGESAGGASVCDQVASPTANGLFERGISISGFYNFNVNTIWWQADCKSKLQTEAQAQQAGAKFAASVGCGTVSDVAGCLRGVSTATLVKAAGRYLAPTAGGSIGPIANGTTLPISTAQAFAEGKVNKVPLIIGVGQDEFNGGVYTNGARTVVANTIGQYRFLVRQQFGANATKVMRLYPPQRYPAPSPFIAYRTIMADAFSVCPALVSFGQLAKHIPVYAYQDDDSDSPSEGGTQPLGANHSAINRLAHDPPASLDPNQLALQNQVLAEWSGFARNGDPTVPGTPLWPRYTAPGHPVLALIPAGDSTLTPTRTIVAEHHCGFWDALNRSAPWAVHAG
jgi:para-nitrobenzyl esterase